MNSKRRRIVVACGTYGRWVDFLGGLAEWRTEEAGDWEFIRFDVPRFERLPTEFLDRFDGVIANSWRLGVRQLLESLRVPVVATHYGPGEPLTPFPIVTEDEASKAALAVDALLRRKPRSFCFAGLTDVLEVRRRALMDAMRSTGLKTSFVDVSATRDPNGELAVRALEKQPHPVALVTFSEGIAVVIREAARSAGLCVPHDLRILACESSEPVKSLAPTPISVIDTNESLIARRAAEILERAMNGEDVPPRFHLVPPRGVIEHASTDVAGSLGGAVGRAVRFMREHVGEEGMSLDRIARHSGLSKRGLQAAFQRQLGSTIWDEWRELRLDAARRLVDESDVSLAEIAVEVGFSDSAHLSREFRRRYGQSPSKRRSRFST